MNQQILDSVISLTGNADIDSLEVSLLSTIAEYVYCERACIYELAHGFPNPQVDLKLELTINPEQPHFNWRSNVRINNPEPSLVKNIDSHRRKQSALEGDSQELWFPIKSAKGKLCLYICSQQLTQENKTLIAAFARIYGNYLKVLNESERDKLTGLLNRHSFERRLRSMLNKQAKTQKQLQHDYPQRTAHEGDSPWLVILDIDHFKKVNDQFGHVCGDEVLLALAQKMTHFFRSTDYVFRFGGEEFVILMEPTSEEAATQKLDSFRANIAEATFPLVGRITISVGFTRASPIDFEQIIMERADKALYYAKEHGRNAVYCYERLLAEGKIQNNHASAEKADIDLF